MPDEASLRAEALQSVSKGHNGLLDPALLPDGQMSRLHNVVVRNGLAESRPRLVGEALPVQGRFQGAFVYELEDAVRWVVVVSGQVWVHNLATSAWKKVYTFPTAGFEQAFFCQAESYCVVQNGVYDPVENWPAIISGDDLFDNLAVDFIQGDHIDTVAGYNPGNYNSSGDWEPPDPQLAGEPSKYRVPIGKAMAYGQGRLFVAVERYWDDGSSSGRDPGWVTGTGLRQVLASDDYRWDDTERMLVFTETYVLTGGGALSLPSENGFITAMSFFRNASTGTGLGELMVLSRRGSTMFAVSVQRGGAENQWGAAGFGQQLFQSSGSASPWSVAAVNADLVYYGDGGLRTIKYSASNETSAGGLASSPLSPEVTNYTAATLEEHEPYVTTALADNYLFFTAGGTVLTDGSVAFTDLLPWDLVNFQVSGEQPARVFSGAWRGPLFHAVLRASRSQAGVVYRDGADGSLKYGVFTELPDADLVSVVRTGAKVFEAPLNIKRVKYADLMFDRVSTNLDVRVRWRVDGGKYWTASDTRHFISTSAASTGIFRVPIEADVGGAGYMYEFAVEWTGHGRLKMCLFYATIEHMFSGGEDSVCATVDLGRRESVPDGGSAAAPEE